MDPFDVFFKVELLHTSHEIVYSSIKNTIQILYKIKPSIIESIREDRSDIIYLIKMKSR